MRKLATSGLALALLLAAPAARAEEGAAEAYARALERETTERDPKGAAEIYRGIVEKHRAEDEVAAKAQFRLGECLEKLGDAAGARAAWEAVVRDFPGQAAMAQKAADRLAALGGGGEPAEPEADAVQKKLDTMRIDLDFMDSTLTDIAGFLMDFSGISGVIDPAAEGQAEKKVSIRIKDLPLRNTLALVAGSYGVETVLYEGAIVWTTAERAAVLKKRVPLRLEQNAAAEDRAVMDKLQRIRMSVNFTGTPLGDIAGFLMEVSGITVVVRPGAESVPATIRFDEKAAAEIVDLLGFLTDTEVTIENGAVVIAPKK